MLAENDKNQICSKLREMVRKLVETDFWILPSSSEARLEVSVASQPTAGARIFGPVWP